MLTDRLLTAVPGMPRTLIVKLYPHVNVTCQPYCVSEASTNTSSTNNVPFWGHGPHGALCKKSSRLPIPCYPVCGWIVLQLTTHCILGYHGRASCQNRTRVLDNDHMQTWTCILPKSGSPDVRHSAIERLMQTESDKRSMHKDITSAPSPCEHGQLIRPS